MYRLLLILLLFSSCRSYNANKMFKTPKDYEFAMDTTTSITPLVYLIQPGDKLALHIYSNDGFKLVDITSSTNFTSEGNTTMNDVTFSVDNDSTTKFPIIGRHHVVGLSVREAEKLLEGLYSKYYNDPFIILKVTNRFAYVFLNDEGKGFTVQLNNDNTSLYEALAEAGGIGEMGKSYKIKILRGDPKNPKVYQADLSSLEGLKTSELRVLSNDIIYVDASSRFTKRLTTDILPILGIVTTLLLIGTYINR
ncbi:MAG TPA: polysaccharide biosynthesis/export family protein [Bacteroidia bacterium]|nr:polysaccharide biosynthesis/export family protein [Bacteroidota bacterium]MBP9789261.1 polysaccharide biosynthesis/export family protein [Bacteroidia bacterium]MBK7430380.1 polysaccharide biosynthesis/export family protein [Bacteroidota bacterium]MBK7573539.1 polysaccharide biosynthesis/export family protein [Bacteroidota bacterium]MBK8585301.1 polysaccharide biosynthesis/export family protein [Bacteroidota bacterium]